MSRYFAHIPSLLTRMAQSCFKRPVRYAGAVAIVVLCCILRAQLPATALPYLFFIPGLMIIGFWFGVGPSLVGCVLAVLSAQFFFTGPIGFSSDNLTTWLNSSSFGLVTLAMAVVCAFLRRTLISVHSMNQHLEEEVERRTQERDGIWNVSPDLICTLSESGELLAMNPAWPARTGCSEQELKHGGFYRFITSEQVTEALQRLREQPIAELDTQGERANGELLHLNWRIAQRHGRYFAVARDVTLQKARQEALDEVRSQLQQSQKMDAIGQLTGGLAHDFNNLLTVITGSLDMFESRLDQGRFSELPRYLVLAKSASTRAASLTHRLLAFARRQPLAGHVVDPIKQIRGMKELIARTLTPRIEFEVLTPEEHLLCFCDGHQLENAVLNLCINARDAMPKGGRLRVEVLRITQQPAQALPARPAGDYVQIRVSDTGTGMSSKVLERAFDPFFTTKPLGSGTGLGLSMVYGFARQSSGDVHIESVPGEGTAVSLFLPLHQGAFDAGSSAEPSASVMESTAPRGSVLVLDDEGAIRDLVAQALEDMGHTVIKSETGAQAMQRLQETRDLELLVTDIALPGGISGDEVASATLEAHPTAKVLFISGFSETATPVNGFGESQMQLLPKPFSIGEFKQAVVRLLG
ncbi:ATP-binding protein [Pseudomonas massiliensis]|uniref:ATP-binding protein n=1 Tax=Pseudomonas massiliensis TaxID=522492 RepID=UPI000A87AA69|nr:ATP-binding protein [Pseudomonas massiliensis]